jgi:hypothetical protein
MKNKKISTDATLSIDPRNQGLAVKLGTPSFSLSSSDFKISGDIICKGINLLTGLFKGLLEKELKKALDGIVGDLTCMSCKANADCPSGATCSGGVCKQGGTCLPMDVGFSGAVSLAELLGGLGNPTAKDMWFGINMGGRAEVKTTGLELGMLGGTHASQHPCVKPIKFPPVPAPSLFAFPGNAPDGKPYMMGAAISQAMMTKAAQSLYSNGALCIRIDSSISPDLGGVFSVKNLGGLISPSLPKLVGSGDAPLVIGLRPSQPIDLSIGKGTIGKDAKGNDTVKDPLIDLKIPKLNFDFLVFLHDRWTRLFTYQVDVALPLALAVKPGNKLGLVLGDLNTAMSNPTVINSHMVKEDNTKLANGLFNLLKAVLPLATGSLGNQEFDLPDLQGLKLSVKGITGQKPRSDRPGRFEFLTLYADLGVAPTGKPLLPESKIGMTFVELRYPVNMRKQLSNRDKLSQWPSVVVSLDDFRPDREYSFKLNSSMWTPYKQGKQIVLENPQLLLQGTHTLYVRSRSITHPSSEDNGSGILSFKVDYSAPQINVQKTDQELKPIVKDNLSLTEQVQLAYKVNDGSWIAMSQGDSIPMSTLKAGDRVQFKALDAQNNTAIREVTISKPGAEVKQPAPTQAPVVAAPVQKNSQPPHAAMSCESLGGQPAVPMAFLLLLAGLLAFRRRVVR